MKRTVALLTPLVLVLVAAPAAVAKGPHAALTFGSEAVKAGEPADVTLEMMETKGQRRPMLMARRGDRLVVVRGRRVWSDGWASRYRLSVVLPAEGRWRLEVVDGKRRFGFPAVAVGSGTPPQDWVSFPDGSRAKRAGGGGPWIAPEPESAGGGALPPEVIRIADGEDESDGGGGVPLWILPAAGLVLAGAGVWRIRAR